jgi:RNA polymerase sigma factor (sigma-70 family)
MLFFIHAIINSSFLQFAALISTRIHVLPHPDPPQFPRPWILFRRRQQIHTGSSPVLLRHDASLIASVCLLAWQTGTATWLRVLERGHQYDGKWKFEAWLFAIARNLVLDWHRRKKPQSIDSLAGPEEDAVFDVKDERSESPLDQVLHSERRSGVQQSLDKVPAIYREVLVLRFQEEMRLDEIAGVTGVPP